MQTLTETSSDASVHPRVGRVEQGALHQDGRRDTLEFVRAMLGQLHHMAAGQRCVMLAYLIEMATVEAADIIESDRRRSTAGDASPRSKG